jgi:hypothetical protein
MAAQACTEKAHACCSLGKVVKVISNFLRELCQLHFLRGTMAVQVLPGCEVLTHAYV